MYSIFLCIHFINMKTPFSSHPLIHPPLNFPGKYKDHRAEDKGTPSLLHQYVMGMQEWWRYMSQFFYSRVQECCRIVALWVGKNNKSKMTFISLSYWSINMSLLHSVCITNYQRLSGFKQQTFVFHSSRGWEDQNQGTGRFGV